MGPNATNNQKITSVQVNSTTAGHIHNQAIIGSLVVSFPVLLLLGIVGYKKYRATVLRQQIRLLEKIWRINVNENTY